MALSATDPRELAGVFEGLGATQRDALERHGLAAYLVAGPALQRKLSTGLHAPGDDLCQVGVALVYAAVDWARCGRTDAVSEETLRALWPNSLVPGEAATDEGFQRALEWALAPVAGSIALLQRTGSYLVFDYVVRLVSGYAATPPVRAECWAAAVATASGGQAQAVGVNAYFRFNKETALQAFARARMSSAEIAAVSGVNLGVVLGEMGRSEEGIEAYDEVLARFGDAPEAALREPVAKALVNKGVTLGVLGRSEGDRGLRRVLARFGDAPEAALRDAAARARAARVRDEGTH